MRPYIISNEISSNTVAKLEEQNASFPGIAIAEEPVRDYIYDNLASHIIGYVGNISSEEYNNNQGYLLDDYIGKTGIESLLESYLRGKNGIKQIDMSIDRNNNRRIYYRRSNWWK